MLQILDKRIRTERATDAGMRVQHVGYVRDIRLADEAIPVGYKRQQRTHPDEFIVRSGRMGPGARPRPVLRPCTAPRTDGIKLHISGSDDEMPPIHHERAKFVYARLKPPGLWVS